MMRTQAIFLAMGLLAATAGAAHAAPPACPAAPMRWQDDCSGLAGKTLTGLDRMRYIPLGDQSWLTLGGEARVRSEALNALNFGVGDKPPFVELGGRLLFQGDLHFGPRARIFGQLAALDESGRIDRRSADRDRLDLMQLFGDVPVPLPGGGDLVARLGRQELDLSNNRLVNTRDGIVARRAFQGALFTAEYGDLRAKAFHVRPMQVLPGVFDDHFDHTETFDGLSVDFPTRLKTELNAFVFQRTVTDANYIDFSGAERRWSAGVHLITDVGPLDVDTEATVQWGKTPTGQDIRAFGGGSIVTYTFSGRHVPRLVSSLLYASGDKRQGDDKLQTFDPLYPSNYGLSAAPFLYQTNYALAGTQGLMRFGKSDLGLAGYYVIRASQNDAVYAQRNPIRGTDGEGAKTALMVQANSRTPLNDRTDLTFAIVHALVGRNIKAAGGHASTYIRLDVATRF